MVHGRHVGWGPKPMIAVDIFRVANGKLVEHWDIMQEEVEASATASGTPCLATDVPPGSDLNNHIDCLYQYRDTVEQHQPSCLEGRANQ